MSLIDTINTDNLPKHLAIIMDGNGRWARRRKLPVAAGHRAGTKALRRTVEAAIDLGVESVCVFAFSTENWSRPPDEVDALMKQTAEEANIELQHDLASTELSKIPDVAPKEVVREEDDKLAARLRALRPA